MAAEAAMRTMQEAVRSVLHIELTLPPEARPIGRAAPTWGARLASQWVGPSAHRTRSRRRHLACRGPHDGPPVFDRATRSLPSAGHGCRQRWHPFTDQLDSGVHPSLMAH